MSQSEVLHSKEPIRLFQSDFLEFFTHVHPAVIVVIWLPVVIYCLARAIAQVGAGAAVVPIPLGFLVGLFLWTLAEYTLHRFLFHLVPRNPRQERMVFMLHGVHHAQPLVKTRLVMPPVVSIPMAILFYGLYVLILGVILGIGQWVAPMFAGFVLGYLLYDLTHYSVHHIKVPGGYFKMVRGHHMRHHSQHPVSRFGVSSPLWDIVFHTR